MASLPCRLMEDRERLAQQLAAEQSDGRAEAERMRLELEKLAAHHAEALQLAAEQQWRAEQRLRGMPLAAEGGGVWFSAGMHHSLVFPSITH